jgi:hypothetical protein
MRLRRDRCSFETGQVPNSVPNFETCQKSKFDKTGVFETGPCNLAGPGFETGVAERALSNHPSIVRHSRSNSVEAVPSWHPSQPCFRPSISTAPSLHTEALYCDFKVLLGRLTNATRSSSVIDLSSSSFSIGKPPFQSIAVVCK